MKKIRLSGVVGWDFTAADLAEQLEAANRGPVEVYVSSGGGLVSEALEMFNLIRNYEGETTAILSGFAMSAASYIPLAADKVVAEDNAVYMIHNVHGGVWGDHNDILHYGAMCKGLSGMFAKAYARHTGKDAEEMARLMDGTTFFYGDQIVDACFADELVETDNDGDEEGATATAKLAFQETTTKLSSDQAAIKKDLNRASALALGATSKKRVMTPKNNEEPNMDLKELKAKYPDLVAAITKEATEGMGGKLEAAKTEGAGAERDRIKAVYEQMYPGHEEIVKAAMFDGESDAGSVAMQVLAAEKAATQQAGKDLSDDAPAPVMDPAQEPQANADTGLTPEQQWEQNINGVKDEFSELDDYIAYLDATGAGLVKTLGGK